MTFFIIVVIVSKVDVVVPNVSRNEDNLKNNANNKSSQKHQIFDDRSRRRHKSRLLNRFTGALPKTILTGA